MAPMADVGHRPPSSIIVLHKQTKFVGLAIWEDMAH